MNLCLYMFTLHSNDIVGEKISCFFSTCTSFFNVFFATIRATLRGRRIPWLLIRFEVMDVMAFLGGFQLYCEMLGSGGDGKPTWERCVL